MMVIDRWIDRQIDRLFSGESTVDEEELRKISTIKSHKSLSNSWTYNIVTKEVTTSQGGRILEHHSTICHSNSASHCPKALWPFTQVTAHKMKANSHVFQEFSLQCLKGPLISKDLYHFHDHSVGVGNHGAHVTNGVFTKPCLP